MGFIKSQISANNDEYKSNLEHNTHLAADLQEKLAGIRTGGDEKAQARHHEQQKMFVRDRIATFCDEGAPFLEIGALAGYELYEDPVPAGGVHHADTGDHGRRRSR